MFKQSLQSVAALALIGSTSMISLASASAQASQNNCFFWNQGCTIAATPALTNLTGTWRADNGGTYVIRQNGSNISWTGRGGNWRNTFNGTISGNRITGYWQDTASSQTQNAGQLVLRIDSNNRLSLISRTGAGSSHVWTRSNVVTLPQPGIQVFNLTGTWRADNGGTYVIRQNGSNISWTGRGGNWRNTFNGTISGNRITGYWQDTASSQTQNAGQLVLRIDSNNRLSLISRTGAGSSHVWTRSNVVTLPQPGIQVFNLTGTWRADNGGTYVIRQNGSNISWTGRGGNWRNTFNGTISGNRITGYWQDTASSQTQNAGQLVLRIDSNNRLSLISRTGAGSSHVWTRW